MFPRLLAMLGETALLSGLFVGPFILVLVVAERLAPLERVDARGRLGPDALFAAVSMLGTFVASTLLVRELMRPVLLELAPFAAVAALPAGVRVLLGLLIGDFFYYWMHRLLHVAPFWNAHTMHHSIQNLYWLSSMRSSFLQAVGISLVFSFGFNLVLLDLPQMQAGLMIMGMASLFSHANLRVRLGPLEWVLVTPRHHRMHHVEDPATRDQMFAGIFSFWDRLFGTWVEPTDALLRERKGHELERGRLVRELIGV